MNILAFDTSSANLSVTAFSDLQGGNRISSEINFSGIYQHAEKLIPFFEKALANVNLEIKDCDAFVIGSGPGSFTGLRVGFATLQGLATANRKPCYSICTMDVLGRRLSSFPGQVAVALDAHQGKVYLALYEMKKTGFKQKWKPQCLLLEKGLEKLKAVSGANLCVVGNALEKYDSEFKKSLSGSHFVETKYNYPMSSYLAELFLERQEILKPLKPLEMLPLYLQEPNFKKSKVAHVKSSRS